jgi:uncharacterized protein (DUF1501 family)
MLTIQGNQQTTLCDNLSRREFLRLGALGLGGLTLTDLLGLQARGQAKTTPKAVIMIYLYGGMPHLDMYDMKPKAPAEFRGEFKSIPTNVPGLDICELMPLQAKIADKLAVVRNWEGHGGHNPHELLTGGKENEPRPAFGSVVSRLHGAIRHGVPQYIATSNGVKGPASYAGKANEACIANGDLMKNLTLGVPLEQLADRKSLMKSFDTLRQDLDATGGMAGLDALNARALEMVTTNRVRDALDLNKEPEPVRAKYGRHTNWLQARRLVEAGVSVVSLEGQGDWDTHENNFTVMRRLMPEYDRAVYALITDLYERGLDKDVALVVWSEFGRTPKINGKAGRDHWQTGSVLMSGGGFKTGQFIGATDSRGEKVVGVPYRASHVHATLYSHLGIDPSATIPDFTGRPRYLVDDPKTIVEL